jgi:SAM-dependent methyltransferase
MTASAPRSIASCPGCNGSTSHAVFDADRVPVNSVLLITSREAARAVPTGDIRLRFCPGCGLVWNAAFEHDKAQYDARYESTQAFSGTFSRFHRDLAARLVSQHRLAGKHVVEIGCGQGEFLVLLQEEGIGRATGFDPASRRPAGGGVEICPKPFSAGDLTESVDFLCCKMTLEHIPDPVAFLKTVREALRHSHDPIVFFMVPDATRILSEGAFWDIYYEHVLYFTPETLTRIFRFAGFDVCATESEYDGQYCTVVARPAQSANAERAPGPPSDALVDDAMALSERVDRQIEDWASRLSADGAGANRSVIWGGGSKAVAFLTALRGRIDIAGVVDINPLKHGTFLPLVADKIIPPARLREILPDRVLIMNPAYEAEVAADLRNLGLGPEMVMLGSDSSAGRP